MANLEIQDKLLECYKEWDHTTNLIQQSFVCAIFNLTHVMVVFVQLNATTTNNLVLNMQVTIICLMTNNMQTTTMHLMSRYNSKTKKYSKFICKFQRCL